MVDALIHFRRMLRPDGCLIDIHPTTDLPRVEIGDPSGATIAAWDLAAGDAQARHAAADRAQAAVVERGLFALEARHVFDFHRHADSADKLAAYVTANWKSTRVDDRTRIAAADALRAQPGGRLWMRERVHIARLRPTGGVLRPKFTCVV